MPFDPNQPFETLDAPPAKAAPVFNPNQEFKAFDVPPVEDVESVANSLYPGVRIGSAYRPPNHPLSKKNPSSLHQTPGAIDVAAIPGMSFDDYVNGYKKAGYSVLEAIDEYNDPSPWATGGHWHIVLGKDSAQAPEFDPSEPFEVVESPPAPAKEIDQNVSVDLDKAGSGTLPSGTTAWTGQELEQKGWISSFLAKNSKTASFDDVIKEVDGRYPGFTKAPGNLSALRIYYNQNRAGQKVPMNWAPEPRQDNPENPDIVVEGDRPYNVPLGLLQLHGVAPLGLKIDSTEIKYLSDQYKRASQFGFPGLAAREVQALLNPDLSREDIAEAQRNLRENLEEQIASNPMDDTVPGALWGFGAGMLGSAGPEYLIPGAIGETAGGRILSAAGINAAIDAAYQGADVAAGVQDEFSPTRGVMSTAMGTAFQGAGEVLKKVVQSRVMPDGKTEPGVVSDPSGMNIEILPERYTHWDGKAYQEFRVRNADGDIISDGRIFDNGQVHYWGDVEPDRKALNEARKNAPRLDRLEPVEPQGIPRGEDLSQKPIDPELEKMLDEEFQKASQELGTPGELVNYKDPTLTQDVNILTTPELEQRIALAQAGKTSEKVTRPDYRTKAYVDQKIAELTSGWKNSPKFNVVDKFDELPEVQQLQILRDTDGRPEDVKAFVDADGTVHAIADHLEGPEDVTALTYHEALGHYGLSLQFGNTLDTFLDRAYKTNPDLREAADAWFLEGGQTPEGVNPRLRATEEVLAERSETGPFDATAWDRIKNIVKSFARKAGMKNLAYSDREIKTILAMAHSKVINGGRNAQVSADGNRYIRKVTHVSPHDFRNADPDNPYGKFDHSFMGTGEGAQIFGWGTYMGEKTRDHYMKEFSKRMNEFVSVNGRQLKDYAFDLFPKGSVHITRPEFLNAVEDVSRELDHYKRNWPEEEQANIPAKLGKIADRLNDEYMVTIQEYNRLAKESTEALNMRTSEGDDLYKKIATQMRSLNKQADIGFFKETIYRNLAKNPLEITLGHSKPITYEVDVYPRQEARMLLWDKPLSEQPEHTKGALAKLGYELEDPEIAVRNAAIRKEGFKKHSEAELEAERLSDITRKYNRAADDFYETLSEKYADVLVQKHKENNLRGGRYNTALDRTFLEEASTPEEWQKLLDIEKAWSEAGKAAQEARIEARTFERQLRSLPPEELKGHEIYGDLHKKLRSDKAASLALRDVGVIGHKYEDGYSRNNEKKTYNFVFFDENEAKIVNKYMRKKRPSEVKKEEAETKANNLAGNLNLDNFDLSGGAEAVVKLVGKEIPKTKVTMEETRAAADALGMTMKEVKAYAAENGGARLLAMRKVLAKSAERTMKIAEAIGSGDNSDLNLALFGRYMAVHRELQERVSKAVGEAGRTLRALREVAKADVDIETLRMMGKKTGMEHLGDRTALEETAKLLLQHKDNPAAQTKIAKDMYSPYWEDYLISFRYNMMLGNLGTHAVNLIGNTGSTYMDLIDRGFASIVGQMKRLFGNKDRIAGREVYARQLGLLQALTNSETYSEALKSFAEGKPTHQVSKVEIGSNLFSKKVGAAGIGVEVPSRALAMSDSFSRSLIEQSAINGLAHRTALKEGLTGDAYRARVAELIENPTTGMRAQGDMEAAILQLVDEPSWMGQMLERLKQHPRRNQYGHRMARFALHMVAPFSRVSDRLFWAAVRRTPIVGFLDKVNQADFAAGGAQRDLVFGRMMTGALLIGSLLQKYNDDELSGSGPSDFRARGAMQAEGWQPNSIKFGDRWYSLRGLDQVAPMVHMVAEFGDTIKDKDFQSEDEITKVLSLVGAAANGMHQNTFLSQLSQLFGTFGKTGLAETNRENYAANMVSSFIPSGVRHASELADGQQRDSSGTGTMGSKVAGAIERSLPGYRKDLPQKYDPYGREMVSNKNLLTLGQNTPEDKTLVVQEMKRLRKFNDGKPIVTPVRRSDLKDVFGSTNVPAEVVQNYQKLSGEYIHQSLQENMATPEWQAMTDEEKVKFSKKVVSQMRKYAREDLFGGNNGGN